MIRKGGDIDRYGNPGSSPAAYLIRMMEYSVTISLHLTSFLKLIALPSCCLLCCFFRISGRNCTGSSRHDQDLEMEDFSEIAQCSYWMFSKMPFKTSLLAGQSHEIEDVAVRMFNSTLVYTGLELSSKVLRGMLLG